MAEQDTLIYFNARGRAENIRMMYALANQPLVDERVNDWEKWLTELKDKQPLGQLPVLKCKEGTVVLTTTIAKYVARKFGFLGDTIWEQTLNDLVINLCADCHDDIAYKIYHWKFFNFCPQPEDPDKLIEKVREKVVHRLKYIQSVAEERGRRFIIGDTIMVADVWLYCLLEFAGFLFQDFLKLNPWVEKFVQRFTSDDRVKAYLSQRPPSVSGV